MQLHLPSFDSSSFPECASPPKRVTLRFSRGTLLAEGLDYQPDVNLEPWRWDPRVACYRSPAHRYLAARRALRREIWTLIDLVARGVGSELGLFPPALRDYQKEALSAWLRSERRGVVVLPTGAGKTHVARAAIAKVNRAALVLVPTRVLLQQWVAALREDGCGDVGVLGDGEHRPRPLTVATFESANRHMERLGDRFALLVVDEAHHVATRRRDEALTLCSAPYRLGLTATPPESFGAQSQLLELLGPVVSRIELDALCGRQLAPFDFIRHRVSLGDEELARYRSERERFLSAFRSFQLARGGDLQAFCAAAEEDPAFARGLRALQASRRMVGRCRQKEQRVADLLSMHRDERVLIFVGDNDAAYALSQRLLVPAITCDIRRGEREEVLQRFRRGLIGAVISARVLNEGIDLPQVRVGIIAGASQGRREHLQRVGRLLRPLAGKRALIHEIVVEGSHEEHAAKRRGRGLVSCSAHRRRDHRGK